MIKQKKIHDMKTFKKVVLAVFLLVPILFCLVLISCEYKNKYDSFTVSFDTNGVVELPNLLSSTSTGKVDKPQVPVVTSYIFDGFYENADYSVEYDFDAVIKQDTKIYAKFSKVKHTIHFDGNGSTSGYMQDIVVNENDSINLPSNVFIKDGYVFIGWGYSVTDSVKNSDGGLYFVTSEQFQILYAKWRANTYKITFDKQGGKDGDDYVDVVIDVVPQNIIKPSKDGYVFVGYYDNKNVQGVQYYNSNGQGVRAWDKAYDAIIYASWVESRNTIVFDGNGSDSGRMESLDAITGDVVELPNCEYTRMGYSFVGWSVQGVILNVGDTFVMPEVSSTLIILATWQANMYYIVFCQDVQKNNVIIEQYLYDDAKALIGDEFGMEGYTLVGWNTVADFSGTHYSIGQVVKNLTTVEGEKIYLYAECVAKTYSVVLDGNGGHNGELQVEATYGQYLRTVVAPTRIGYNFDGYYINKNGTGNKYYDGNMTGIRLWDNANDIILYANWTPRQNTIIFDGNGGMGNPIRISTATDRVEVLPDCTYAKVGYNFDGWDTEKNGNGTRYSAYATYVVIASDDNIVFYAIWIPKSIQIIFDGKNGTGTMTPISAYIESTVILPNNGYVYLGYDFIGYSLFEDSNTVQYKPNDNFIVFATDDNIIIYCVWQVVEYTISYELNGGINASSNPVMYTIESPTIVLQPATKKGYSFYSWSNGGIIVGGTFGDLVVSASYDIISYTITYSLNGGQNNISNPQTYTVETPTFRLQNPTKQSYNFIGWNGEFSIEIQQGSIGDRGYTAEWDGEKYSIRYILNGGVNSPQNPVSYTIDSGIIWLVSATKNGYNFLGWRDETNNIITQIQGNEAKDKILTAQWDIIFYTITYIDNLGVNNPNRKAYTIDDEFFLDELVYEGYSFDGWFDSSDVQVRAIIKGTVGDIVLNAKWTQDGYYLYFYSVDGEQPEEYRYTSDDYGTMFYPKIPSLRGYEFLGWYEDGDDINLITGGILIQQGQVGNRLFYAKWQVIEYNVIYVLVSVGEDLNEVDNSMNDKNKYTIESPTIILNDPIRNGYSFNGWFDTSGNRVFEILQGSVGDITLQAEWILITPKQPNLYIFNNKEIKKMLDILEVKYVKTSKN